MSSFTADEAQANLSEVLDRAAAGETIDITLHGKTVAQLAAPMPPRRKVNLAALAALTADLPHQAQSAEELVRAMRDDAPY